MNTTAQPILTATDLTMDYAAQAAKPRTAQDQGAFAPHPLALNRVNFTLHPGETVAVMGPSGSGKSTLLHALAGIITPTAGTVQFRGANLAAMPDAERTALRRNAFGFVFQSGQLLPELPAVENIALPLMLGGMPYAQATSQAVLWLERFGLRPLMAQRPGEMSGGQMQRVAIARALVNDPAVILADEATGNLDTRTSFEMLVLFQRLHAEGRTIIFVTHNPEIAQYSSRNIMLRDGKIREDVINGHALSAAEALAALPKPQDD